MGGRLAGRPAGCGRWPCSWRLRSGGHRWAHAARLAIPTLLGVQSIRVAVLGDSLSEGVGDPAPGSWGRRLHGWVHHLVGLGADRGVLVEPLLLARRGAHVGHVAALQLPAVPDRGTDVAVLLVGFNDVLHRDLDTGRFVRLYDQVSAQLAQRAQLLVVGTLHDLTRTLPLPPGLARAVRGNIAVVNEAVRAVAVRHDAAVLDLAALQHRVGAATISIDLLHPSRSGHQQIAAVMAEQLADRGLLPASGRPVLTDSAAGATTSGTGAAGWPGAAGADRSARLVAEGRHLLWLVRDGGPWFARELYGRRRPDRRPPG